MSNILFSGKSDVGLKRKRNEDAFVVNPELGFCLAADGMGGAAAGELASRIFAETASSIFSGSNGRSEEETLALVKKSFFTANKRILEHAAQNIDHKGMGCTAELVAFTDGGYVLGHIGDSRTYRLRDGQLEQLTRDHSFVQDQVNQGLITPEQAKQHHLRNVILRAVGVTEKLVPDLLNGKAQAGDVFLLCSDGLTDMVDDGLIQKVLSSTSPLLQKFDALIEAANSAGGSDNVTVVLSEIESIANG